MNKHAEKARRLCLVGGGHSHAIVIRQLRARLISGLDSKLKIMLISPDRYTPYSGMLPGLVAGHYSYEDCHIDLHRLCEWAGIQFVCATVSRIDPDNRLIYSGTSDHTLQYDLLSINTGSRPAIDDIAGACAFGCAVKPVKSFLDRWNGWLNNHCHSQQQQHIIIVGGGAAGVEVLLAMHYKLNQTTAIKAVFTLINRHDTILATHNLAVQQFFKQHLSSLNIQVINNAIVTAIDNTQLHLNNGASLCYDFAAWAIHAGAQPWHAASRIACDPMGFITVDRYLRSTSHANIFATGDCAAFLPRKLPKAGVYAVRQAPVLFNNLLAAHGNRPLVAYKPQQHFLSLLTTGKRHAVASRDVFFFRGKWVWYWKNHIDRKFMRRFIV